MVNVSISLRADTADSLEKEINRLNLKNKSEFYEMLLKKGFRQYLKELDFAREIEV